ncbi:MAG: phosphatidate cytidylyltransferase, partial [Eubacterium coprostanoligenes]|uniref:phosphatidate cytidylyltransferase n=1 Tax=Eubacterium coprostanoligenes TaxID=290054 RepID=UPI0023547BCD
PHISPKKTKEGALCGICTSFVLNIFAMLLFNKLAYSPLNKNLVTTLLIAEPFVAFLSMMGDLSASVLKRNFDVKDFGKIFPGHGGVMDRFDSSLFSIPLTYCVVEIFNNAIR